MNDRFNLRLSLHKSLLYYLIQDRTQTGAKYFDLKDDKIRELSVIIQSFTFYQHPHNYFK